MTVRLTCVDNASGHDGLRWRMGEDAQSVTTVVGETAPGVAELVVAEPIKPEACFSVAAYSGGDEGEAASACAETGPEDFSTAVIGDEIGGGIYAGIDAIAGTSYHIICGKAESELTPESGDTRWKTSQTATTGTGSETDGLANTQAMEAAGLADHPAAAHCLAYAGGGHTDWHMPARSQVTLLYNNLASHAEFASNVSAERYTRSSTEQSNDARRAWSRIFSSGDELTINKDFGNLHVRPIRRVAA